MIRENVKKQLKKYCNYYSVYAETEVVEKIEELSQCKGVRYTGLQKEGIFYKEVGQRCEEKQIFMEGYGLDVRDYGHELRLGYFSNGNLTRGFIYSFYDKELRITEGRLKNGALQQGTLIIYNQMGKIQCEDITDNGYEKATFFHEKKGRWGHTTRTYFKQELSSTKKFLAEKYTDEGLCFERVVNGHDELCEINHPF